MKQLDIHIYEHCLFQFKDDKTGFKMLLEKPSDENKELVAAWFCKNTLDHVPYLDKSIFCDEHDIEWTRLALSASPTTDLLNDHTFMSLYFSMMCECNVIMRQKAEHIATAVKKMLDNQITRSMLLEWQDCEDSQEQFLKFIKAFREADISHFEASIEMDSDGRNRVLWTYGEALELKLTRFKNTLTMHVAACDSRAMSIIKLSLDEMNFDVRALNIW